MKTIKNILRKVGNILLVSTPLLVPLTWEFADSLAFKRIPLDINYKKTNRGNHFYVFAKSKIDERLELRGAAAESVFYDTNKDGIYDKMTEYVMFGFRAGIPIGREYNLNKNPERFQKIEQLYKEHFK